jgi:hypothetical protein
MEQAKQERGEEQEQEQEQEQGTRCEKWDAKEDFLAINY